MTGNKQTPNPTRSNAITDGEAWRLLRDNGWPTFKEDMRRYADNLEMMGEFSASDFCRDYI